MRGMPLSDDTVTVTLNDDSTIKKLVIDAKGKDKEAVDALTKAIGDVDTARTARDTTAETTTATGEAARLAAQKARLEAEVAAVELAALPADATAVARKTAENKVANLRLEANQKARKAGLPFHSPKSEPERRAREVPTVAAPLHLLSDVEHRRLTGCSGANAVDRCSHGQCRGLNRKGWRGRRTGDFG